MLKKKNKPAVKRTDLVQATRIDPASLTRDFLNAFRRSVEAIWDAGQVLVRAKQNLGHGQFQHWIDESLPISIRTAQQLMRIAQDPNISWQVNNHRWHHETGQLLLPNDQRILTELCGLEEDQFNGFLAAGTIHPEMRRGELRVALAAKAHPVQAPILIAPPEDAKYRVIMADPPWQFRGGKSRSADRHYPTMPMTDIEMMPVMNLAAQDAILFLWITPDILIHAPRIMMQWGFEYKTVAFVWVKPPPAGLGYWTRKSTEMCLLGTRGKPKRKNADVTDLIHAPRGMHSEKPLQVYDDIERLVDGPYIELFARQARSGWDAWGNDPGLNDGAQS